MTVLNQPSGDRHDLAVRWRQLVDLVARSGSSADSPAVSEAMLSGFATQKHLMAAGYNSNPARLPGYLNRGGENWATLIPRETKIYLQIYDSVERNVPVTPRSR